MSQNIIPWVVFKLKDEFFAISSQNVMSIVKAPKITILPQTPEYIKGIFRYRDEIFRLVDLRRLFSMKSTEEEYKEFSDLMDARANDHKNWLEELDKSVSEKRQFSLTTDPHKCAFGKWYDNFHSDNFLLQDLLQKFELPHKKIHAIAVKVEEAKQVGDFEKAHELIEKERKGNLAEMLNLFGEIKVVYKNMFSDLAVIMKDGNRKCAIAVDSVTSVETLNEIDTKNISETFLDFDKIAMVCGLAKTHEDQTVIRISDCNVLAGQF